MSQQYTVGDGSPFLKRVVVPFYIVRIAVMLLNIIVYSSTIAIAVNNKNAIDRESGTEHGTTYLIAAAAVILAIIAACLILDIVCIVKRSRRTLTPLFFLVANCIQTAIWTVIFGLTVAASLGSPITIVVSLVIYISFLNMLLYGSIIYHRHRKGTLRGDYAPANQNQPTAYYGHSDNQQTKPFNSESYNMENRYA
ncbi:uncharacterized protein CTRU02_213254 [Colletotrichum truncatum]|uniref:Uncharacterized protein n=1 Tax=Colletotrichum truncatum TaxID=5467 RepID=A0ACC3YKR0_COLTU|nr:uncharacterized protein CTRU02_12634 [Colletotrichum truncatum]KAF6784372.1 hypothetical protein CTRU02_12634 [Colletotrichum truncatum]